MDAIATENMKKDLVSESMYVVYLPGTGSTYNLERRLLLRVRRSDLLTYDRSWNRYVLL